MKTLWKYTFVGVLLSAVLILPYFSLLGGIVRGVVLISLIATLTAMAIIAKSRFGGGFSKEILNSVLLWLIGGFFLFKLLRDLEDSVAFEGMMPSLFRALISLGLPIAAIMLHIIFTKEEHYERALAWAIGIAGFGFVNFMASKLGIIVSESEAISIVAVDRYRMEPPFAPGLNPFGVLLAYGCLFGIYGMEASIRKKCYWHAIAGAVAVAFCVFIVFLVETRSVIFPVLFYVTWLAFTKVTLRYLLLSCGVASVALVPFLSGTTNFFEWLGESLPQFVLNNFSRHENDLFTFGGRASIWNYGFENLWNNWVPMWGEGPYGRDTRPVFEAIFNTSPGLPTTYHNGPLDILFVYGWVFGILGILAVLIAVAIAFRSIKPENSNKNNLHTLVNNRMAGIVVALVICNLLDSSASFIHFWVLLATAVATIIENDQPRLPHKRPTPASVGLSLDPQN